MIDADTHIMATTPTIVNDGDLTTPPIIDDLPTATQTNGIESEAAIDAYDKYLSAAAALVAMNPLENHSLMRFLVVVSQENITSKAETWIDTADSLNFVSRKNLMLMDSTSIAKHHLKLLLELLTSNALL